MKRRIYRAMLTLALGSVVLFALLSLLAAYFTFAGDYKERLDSELSYVAAALNQVDDQRGYLDALGGKTRITWVSQDGTVCFDSQSRANLMGSHLDRPEIQQALASGLGHSERWSATLGETTFYSAVRLEDGSVLRLALTRTSLFSILMGMLGLLTLFFLAISSLAVWAAGRVTRAIVRPVNNLDLHHPLDNNVYEELSPLLTQLEHKNQQIARQMEELTQRQTQFAAITGHMAEGLVVLNKSLDVLSINKSAARLFHVEGQPPAGGHILSLCRDMALIRALETARESGHSGREVMAYEGRYYQLVASPVRSGGQLNGMVLLILDVTDGMLSEQSRREFSANVSHELKTPLTAILGYAEIMASGMAPEADMRGFAQRIHDEAARLIRLIEDIIRLSRLDEGAPGAREATVDMGELAAKVVRRLEDQAAKAGIDLQAEGEPLKVRGEPAMLEEMVYNLADNAVKYGRPGGWARIHTGAGTLAVSDNGIGIAPEDQARVFERFYRVDKSHSKAVGGTGLGLSIVKHAAALLGAKISLKSDLGQGTRIEINFPPSRLA